MFPGNTALTLGHRNLLISNLLICILIKNLLPDTKQQSESNVVGWIAIIQIANQFFEELKTTVLQIKSL